MIVYEAIRVNKRLGWSYFTAVDFNDSALTTTGEFPFHIQRRTFAQLNLGEQALELNAHER